jgi:hypothetical protein
MVNGNEDVQYHSLVDGIHPHSSILCKPFTNPKRKNIYHFVIAQISCKEGMKHAFGVLQVCFHIIVNPFWLWDQKIILDILMANVLIHNMILEDKCNEDLNNFELVRDIQIKCKLYFKHIENTKFNYQLKNDLIEHLWALKGNKHT